jgi:hypothetical protein
MQTTYIFLLFIHVTDLEPDVGVCKGAGRISKDAVEARQRVLVFALLLIDDAETEENLVGLVNI